MNPIIINSKNKNLYVDKNGDYLIRIEIIVDKKFKTYEEAIEYRKNMKINIINDNISNAEL